ncbi:MAG TPA: hypothetical protein VF294_12440, partial [Polyangiaceae bacterium]
GSFVPGETYLPDEIAGARFYDPTSQGLEKAIGERLRRLRGLEPSEDPDAEPSAKPGKHD